MHTKSFDKNSIAGLSPDINSPSSTNSGRYRTFFARNSKFISDSEIPIIYRGSVDIENCSIVASLANPFIKITQRTPTTTTEEYSAETYWKSDHVVNISNCHCKVGGALI